MRAVVYTAVFIILQLSCTSALFNIPLRCFLLDVECTKTLVQNLVPSLSKSVDPMYIDFLRVDEQGFQGDLKNLTVTGSKNSIVDDVTLDLDKKEVTLQYHTDFTIRGRYKASPLDPEADLSMLIRNIHITFVMPFEITQNANDYKFVYLSGFKYDYQIKENVQSNINDLLHHTFRYDPLNNSRYTKLIAIPFGRSFMDKIMGKAFETIKAYLLSEPLFNLFMY